METQIISFLREITNKLGTKAEYLWSILIKQAQISAITDLFYYLIVIISGVILYKYHKQFSKKEYGYNKEYTKYFEDDGTEIIMIALFILWLIFLLVSLMSIEDTITKFINPEYWALKNLIK